DFPCRARNHGPSKALAAMNVLVRSRRVESTRRRGERVRGVGPEQPNPPETASPSAPHPTKVRPPVAVSGGDVRRERGTCNGRPLTNDQAVYHCQCGFVFEAPVSTSVGCPHCGSTQAW